jgi:hypothetical protein
MSFYNSLDARSELAAANEPASEVDIEKLVNFARLHGCELAEDYKTMLRERTEVEFVVENVGCIRFWAPDGVFEMDEAYDFPGSVPNAVAIGDDEGGMALLLMHGEAGFGLYRMSFSDRDPTKAVVVAPSLDALLRNGVGLDRLFGWRE